MGVLELVDRFRLGRNGCKTVQVQLLSSIIYSIYIWSLAVLRTSYFVLRRENQLNDCYKFAYVYMDVVLYMCVA